MKELFIKELEANQRLDKFLHKYLKAAPNSFIYKMMRKKNIVLNGKKVSGNEILQIGDCVKLFLADETIDKFRGSQKAGPGTDLYERAFKEFSYIKVLKEFKDVIFLNKPAGILSQRADGKELSANEWLIGYLLKSEAITESELETFKPSVCNRLDRNTSGILICSKTLFGSQEMAKLLKDRSLHKYYQCVVKGTDVKDGIYEAYLFKDIKNNKVIIKDSINEFYPEQRQFAKYIKTGVRKIFSFENQTLLEVELFTGKTHQIRAQMEYLGFPIVGDVKYAGERTNLRTDGQLLHAYRLVFPKLTGTMAYLSDMEIICECEWEKFKVDK